MLSWPMALPIALTNVPLPGADVSHIDPSHMPFCPMTLTIVLTSVPLPSAAP